MKKEIDFEEAKTAIIFTEVNGKITNIVVKGKRSDILAGIVMILTQINNSSGVKISELAEMLYQGALELELLQNGRSKNYENWFIYLFNFNCLWKR